MILKKIKICTFFLLITLFFSTSIIFADNYDYYGGIGNYGGIILQSSILNKSLENLNIINRVDNGGLWIRPYRMQDDLNNRTNVLSNTITGLLLGIDLNMKESNLLRFYMGISYIESKDSNYKMNILKQNSYILGAAYVVTKDEFYFGINGTINSNQVNIDSYYGTENFGTLMFLLGAKVGYNIFLGNKFVLEPNLAIMYGKFNGNENVIDKDKNTNLLTEPQIKIKVDLINNWQPYVKLGYVLNSKGNLKLLVGDSLEEINISQYIEYGLGLNKCFSNNKFIFFVEANKNNGDRNGFGCNLGIRYNFLNKKEKEELELKNYIHKKKKEKQKKLEIEKKVEQERLEQEEIERAIFEKYK